jgi:uncharacterized protein (DUF488 family)
VSATILTIGHSNHSFDAFVALLRGHGVTLCADVRSSPLSRRHPHFGREPLREALARLEIGYVFLGRELGGRPSDPACYEQGQVRYRRVARTAPFQSGLERLVEAAASQRVAVMCAERDPLACHRTLLVGRELAARGIAVSHIHADGRLEPHDDAMTRLLAELHLDEAELFRTREERIEEACAAQERKMAYVVPDSRQDSDDVPR